MTDIFSKSIIVLTLFLSLSLLGVDIVVDVAKPLNVSKSGDDVTQLKRLALNVGSEFEQNRITEAYLKSLDIDTLRLINVSISGRFDEQGNFVDIKPSKRLKRNLSLCQRVGAKPHIIIHGLPHQLLKTVPLKVTRHRALGIDLVHKRQKIGPTDYKLLENWFFAYFEYIKIKCGFKNAILEIFNEPDLGTLIYPSDKIPPKGSSAAYECMMKIYRAASNAAKHFEAKYPDCKLKLGAPSGLAFTYKMRGGGWTRRFVTDCAKEDLKLDFLSIHHYSNIAPFRGEIRPGTNYPSFTDMITGVQAVIDRDMPGLPIWLTEYGPHHNVSGRGNTEEINGGHTGAAFSLDCLTAILELGVDKAICLVTTDLPRIDKTTKKREYNFSWCSLLTSPGYFGYPYPKAPYHAYKMVEELSGKRVEASTSGGKTRVFSVFDPKKKTLQVLLWNYAAYIPEFGPPIHEGKAETVKLSITNAQFPPNAKAVLRMVDKDHGDLLSAFRSNRPINLETVSPLVEKPSIQRNGENLEFEFVMQPESIAMLEIGENPIIPSLKTPFSEEAEVLLKKIRKNCRKQPEKALEDGEKLLNLSDVQPIQKLDALKLLIIAAKKAKNTEKADFFAQKADILCKKMKKPLPYVVLRQFADSARSHKKFPDAVNWYKKALKAQDCAWRQRFGTDIIVINCLKKEKKYAEVLDYCDEILNGHNYDKHLNLRDEFLGHKLRALRQLGKTDQMFTVYKKLLNSKAKGDAKIGGVMIIMSYYRRKKDLAKVDEEAKIGLAISGVSPGVLGKFKALLKQIEIEKEKIK